MITRDEALKEMTQSASAESEPKEDELEDAQSARIEADGRRKYFALRSDWSGYIASWISALILFNAGLTIGVGAGLMNFDNMEWFVTAVTVETFLQIVGMGYIAVKYLFSDSSSKSRDP